MLLETYTIILYVFEVLDIVSTVIGLQKGLEELNPLPLWLLLPLKLVIPLVFFGVHWLLIAALDSIENPYFRWLGAIVVAVSMTIVFAAIAFQRILVLINNFKLLLK